MSKKAYSEQEREQIKQDLLTVGLKLLANQGLQNTRLSDIIQTVGISKPFFYTFYDSLADLVICILDYQQELLFQVVQQVMAQEALSLEERICCFLQQVTFNNQQHFFVMTQEEELWVFKRLDQEAFEMFQSRQVLFYEQLLSLWNIPQEKCSPKELGNLILSVVLIHNSATRSLPFFFSEELEQTATAQTKALSQYLVSLIGSN